MSPPRVVFDCNIFIQALGSPQGPSGRCVKLFLDRKIELIVAPETLAELREVTSRPNIVTKLRIARANVEELLDALRTLATLVTNVPIRFVYKRDPDDSIYINLAIAAGAKVIVSRDNDLLDLMDANNPQHQELVGVYPELRVLDPVKLLTEVDDSNRS